MKTTTSSKSSIRKTGSGRLKADNDAKSSGMLQINDGSLESVDSVLGEQLDFAEPQSPATESPSRTSRSLHVKKGAVQSSPKISRKMRKKLRAASKKGMFKSFVIEHLGLNKNKNDSVVFSTQPQTTSKSQFRFYSSPLKDSDFEERRSFVDNFLNPIPESEPKSKSKRSSRSFSSEEKLVLEFRFLIEFLYTFPHRWKLLMDRKLFVESGNFERVGKLEKAFLSWFSSAEFKIEGEKTDISILLMGKKFNMFEYPLANGDFQLEDVFDAVKRMIRTSEVPLLEKSSEIKLANAFRVYRKNQTTSTKSRRQLLEDYESKIFSILESLGRARCRILSYFVLFLRRLSRCINDVDDIGSYHLSKVLVPVLFRKLSWNNGKLDQNLLRDLRMVIYHIIESNCDLPIMHIHCKTDDNAANHVFDGLWHRRQFASLTRSIAEEPEFYPNGSCCNFTIKLGRFKAQRIPVDPFIVDCANHLRELLCDDPEAFFPAERQQWVLNVDSMIKIEAYTKAKFFELGPAGLLQRFSAKKVNENASVVAQYLLHYLLISEPLLTQAQVKNLKQIMKKRSKKLISLEQALTCVNLFVLDFVGPRNRARVCTVLDLFLTAINCNSSCMVALQIMSKAVYKPVMAKPKKMSSKKFKAEGPKLMCFLLEHYNWLKLTFLADEYEYLGETVDSDAMCETIVPDDFRHLHNLTDLGADDESLCSVDWSWSPVSR